MPSYDDLMHPKVTVGGATMRRKDWEKSVHRNVNRRAAKRFPHEKDEESYRKHMEQRQPKKPQVPDKGLDTTPDDVLDRDKPDWMLRRDKLRRAAGINNTNQPIGGRMTSSQQRQQAFAGLAQDMFGRTESANFPTVSSGAGIRARRQADKEAALMNARADRGLIETPDQQRAREDAQRDEARKERDIDDQIGFEQDQFRTGQRRDWETDDMGTRRDWELEDRKARRDQEMEERKMEVNDAIDAIGALPADAFPTEAVEWTELARQYRRLQEIEAQGGSRYSPELQKKKADMEARLADAKKRIDRRNEKEAEADAAQQKADAEADAAQQKRAAQIKYFKAETGRVDKGLARLDTKEDALRKQIDTIDSSISTNETVAAGLTKDQDKEKRAKIEADTEALKKRKLDLEKQLDGFEGEREKLLTERKTYRDQWGGMIGIQQPGQQPAGEAPAGEAPAGEAPIVTPEEIKHAIGVVGL
ncbi:MAG TPA: hypothetical protein VM223_00810 [Planctomycetota bacterium]|nr:hypothetical protein [Planctomycetota bacterium]